MDELLDAFEFVSAGHPLEHEVFLCLETGAFYYVSNLGDLDEAPPGDIENTEKYVAVPHKNELELRNRLAIRFIEETPPDALDDAHDIFRREGAYSRFKDLLERRGVLQKWYDFEEGAKRGALRQWCIECGIDVRD
jgi:hypothetical protein